MRPVDALIEHDDPGLRRLARWVEDSPHRVDVLPPSEAAAECLLALQVTTRSLLGTVAHETGGLLIADGWLRVLGSGAPTFTRRIDGWNDLDGAPRHPSGWLIADDAGGGFFALERGTDTVAYFAPDRLVWEDTGLGYGAWLEAMLGARLGPFYEGLRWDGWRFLASALDASKSMFFYPPRFTGEGKDPMASYRGTVPVHESWCTQMDLAAQLAEKRQA